MGERENIIQTGNGSEGRERKKKKFLMSQYIMSMGYACLLLGLDVF